MILSKNPVGEAVGKNLKTFLTAVGLKISEVSWVYMLTVFVVVYATTKLNLPKQLLLDAVMYAALFELVSLPLFGLLSDKIGRRPMYIMGALFTIAFAFPLFWMLESKSTALVTTAIIVAMNFGHGMMFGPEIDLFSRALRSPRSLQRSFAWISGLGGIGRRIFTDYCHRACRVFWRDSRCFDNDDRACAHHVDCRDRGA